jgi:ABC-type lipoprotein release transport system permease subunit
MTSLLFGVEPHDPVSFVSMAVVVLAVAAAATLIPAVRAVRGSPIAALREE